ncbi:hypothetical protein EDEG_03103 [Edhazardia aedis USNM 41457]|uniref:Uncharacterized protein n=1 Tax=Edhazardia aedis (strain USNM 41457) TaxID=1003232 RepID=J8ZS06_EDHAE|nr:hypothetical protein EDEG_03103 [Edhazardia aedis USNM 41457]|eukprot:EJW02483.1 hypothetical protein EDEG_03103 [Edhazardia aedis USNM 41457]
MQFMFRLGHFIWIITIFVTVLITVLNIINFTRYPLDNQLAESAEEVYQKIILKNLSTENALLSCSSYKKINFKLSESLLYKDFNILISEMVVPESCSRYTSIDNNAECKNVVNNLEEKSNCKEVYFQCFSKIKIDHLDDKELIKVYKNKPVPFNTICDDFACYEEYIDPVISFSVLQKCFSGDILPIIQRKNEFYNRHSIEFYLRYKDKRIEITMFDPIYQSLVMNQLLIQYHERLLLLDKNNKFMNSQFSERINLWKKAVKKKAAEKYIIPKILYEIPEDFFKMSKYKYKEHSQFRKLKKAFESYFFEECNKILETKNLHITNAIKYCCEQTGKYRAILQLNDFTSSKFIKLEANTYDHCINPYDPDTVQSRIDYFSAGHPDKNSYQIFLNNGDFYRENVKKTYRKSKYPNNSSFPLHFDGNPERFQLVGHCILNES